MRKLLLFFCLSVTLTAFGTVTLNTALPTSVVFVYNDCDALYALMEEAMQANAKRLLAMCDEELADYILNLPRFPNARTTEFWNSVKKAYRHVFIGYHYRYFEALDDYMLGISDRTLCDVLRVDYSPYCVHCQTK